MLIALLLIPRLALGAEGIGEITKISGIGKVERGGQQIDIAVNMPVAEGDKIITMADGEVTITFRDGSKVELGESSSFTIDHYALHGTSRISAVLKLWGGHLRAAVTNIVGPPPVFEVHTPNSVAAVRGTEFETAYIAGRPCPEDRSCMRYTTVGVSKGVVEVRNPGNPAPAVRVTEGYETTIPCELAPTSPAPLGIEELGAPGYH
jgi:ferric-dicitrate binding protein FerR (iron transport regulator)